MATNKQFSGRDTLFDTYKYLLIILVITGHFLEGYKHLHRWMEYLYSFIYLFHMPFFVFISGYFSKHVTTKKLIRSSFLLLETFIILQVGFLLLRNEVWPEWRAIFSPWYAPWYLLSLIWWRWIAYICLKINYPGVCLCIAVIIGLFSGFLSGTTELTGFLAMARTCLFLPFFMAGLYTTPDHIQLIRRQPHTLYLVLSLLVALSLIFFSGNDFNMIEYGNGFHWNTLSPMASFKLFGERCYFLLSASILILCLFNLVPSWRVCAGFGMKTMFFFSYHIFFIIFFNYTLRKWIHIPHPDWWYPLICILMTITSLNISSRFSLFTDLLNPLSFLIKKLSQR